MTIDDFIDLINEFLVFFQQLTATEQQKLQAAVNHNILELEDLMKKEQAEVLRFRGLDKKRLEIQAALHFDDLPLKDILPLVQQSHSSQCRVLFAQLDDAVKLYQNTYATAKTALETNLYRVNQALAAKKPTTGQVYSPTGQTNPSPSGGHFTSRQV